MGGERLSQSLLSLDCSFPIFFLEYWEQSVAGEFNDGPFGLDKHVCLQIPSEDDLGLKVRMNF